MSGNRLLPELLDGLSPEALGLFCLTCAERGRAIYETLACDADVASYDRLLELAWASAVGDADEEDVVAAFEAAEERLVPGEDGGEDGGGESPEGERFYVEQAGLLVLNAVATQLNPSVHAATLASNTLETLTGSLDHVLAGSPVQIREADQPEPPLGPLQRVERGAQQAVLTRLRSSSSSPGPGHVDLATLREQAAAPVRRIAEGVAAAQRRGWTA